jgi:hypothetical protein
MPNQPPVEMFHGIDADTQQEFLLVVVGNERTVSMRDDKWETWSAPVRLNPRAVTA